MSNHLTLLYSTPHPSSIRREGPPDKRRGDLGEEGTLRTWRGVRTSGPPRPIQPLQRVSGGLSPGRAPSGSR
ncbi:hypothetical protein GCM10010493_13820 [Streptomyces lavendulae subsp. grasserius]